MLSNTRNMERKAKKQNKLMETTSSFIKVIGKCKMCIDSCLGKRSCNGRVCSHIPQSAGSMSTRFSTPNKLSDDDEMKELDIRYLSKRSPPWEGDKDKSIQEEECETEMVIDEIRKRCYRFDVGKIGRIDEERACSFIECRTQQGLCHREVIYSE
ncbi:hypothetical protein K2173_023984 [Erythroxylum novogranatense]|uniref:Uncharacterized protein n=1 Tax=Erythroxylum novogranatense TaxID=1862640 RepID=A0AAV8TSY3_9ROSI|nr:hypothetical protein K2173_023984 [Erythroxylum novogranatense]